MKRVITIGMCSVIGCANPAEEIIEINQFPVAQITSHSEGDQILAGVQTLFIGEISDPDHKPEELLVSWYADDEVLCGPERPEKNGASRCEGEIREDTEMITLSVRDIEEARVSSTISIQSIRTDAPNVQLLSPNSSQVYYSDQLIHFRGFLSDAEDNVTDLIIHWTSSIDGDLREVDTNPTSDGEISGYQYLSEGEHIIELHVEDSTGKINKDSLTITVHPQNARPACEIISPLSSSAGENGELVQFQALVSDPDSPNYQLSVEWSSDKDGYLGASIPNNNGLVSFPFDDLSLNTHVISMFVTDEQDELCISNIIYTVGTAPEVELLSPDPNQVYNEGDSILFEAEISALEDSASQLRTVWESSIDGVISTSSASSNGNIQFYTNALSYGLHDITLRVIDGQGRYSEKIFQLEVNGLPTQPELNFSPNPAGIVYTTDDLIVNAMSSQDPEGDIVTYNYKWLVNGIDSGYSSAIIPASATAKGESWTVYVTPFDGSQEGAYAIGSVTISNSEPQMQGVTISSDPFTMQDSLMCMHSAVDADDDDLFFSYLWSKNGEMQSTTSQWFLDSFQAGDEITCTVTPHDDEDAGAAMSHSITVLSPQTDLENIIITDEEL